MGGEVVGHDVHEQAQAGGAARGAEARERRRAAELLAQAGGIGHVIAVSGAGHGFGHG